MPGRLGRVARPRAPSGVTAAAALRAPWGSPGTLTAERLPRSRRHPGDGCHRAWEAAVHGALHAGLDGPRAPGHRRGPEVAVARRARGQAAGRGGVRWSRCERARLGDRPPGRCGTGAVDMAEGTRSLTRARSRVFRTWQSEEPGSQRCRLALGTDRCRTAALSQLRQKVPRALGGAAARPAWSQGPTRQQVGPLRPPCGLRPAFPPTEGRFPHGRRGHSRPLGLMLARGQEPSLALGSRVKPPATKSACSWAHRGHP